jgi:hypothetical protein
MAAKVGDYLKHDPLKLRFTTCNAQTGAPKTTVRRSPSHAVAELIQPGYQQPPMNTLFYELLEISLVELETKKNVRITWMGVHNKEEASLYFGTLRRIWLDGRGLAEHTFVPGTEGELDQRSLRVAGGQCQAKHGRDGERPTTRVSKRP